MGGPFFSRIYGVCRDQQAFGSGPAFQAVFYVSGKKELNARIYF
jgi:hypothetical protein